MPSYILSKYLMVKALEGGKICDIDMVVGFIWITYAVLQNVSFLKRAN